MRLVAAAGVTAFAGPAVATIVATQHCPADQGGNDVRRARITPVK